MSQIILMILRVYQMVSGKLYDITFGEYKPCNKRIMEASDVSGWMKNYQHQQT